MLWQPGEELSLVTSVLNHISFCNEPFNVGEGESSVVPLAGFQA